SRHLFCVPLGLDLRDLHRGERLTVTVLASVLLAPTKLEDDDLLAETLRQDLAGDLRARDGRRAELGALAADEEDVVEGDRVAGVPRELLDADCVAGCDSILLAAGADNCVCHGGRGAKTRPSGGAWQARSQRGRRSDTGFSRLASRGGILACIFSLCGPSAHLKGRAGGGQVSRSGPRRGAPPMGACRGWGRRERGSSGAVGLVAGPW